MALSKSIGSLMLTLSEKQEVRVISRNKIYILGYIMNGVVKNILKRLDAKITMYAKKVWL